MGPNKWKILLVDDDKEIHQTIKATFANDSRFTFISALSGKEAALILTASPRAFALALVDFKMPGLTGPETVRELKRINPELLIAVLSGIETREALKESWEAGAVEFVEKATHPARLREKVLSLCDKYEESVRGLDDEEEKTSSQNLIESAELSGVSDEFAYTVGLALRAAAADCSVLILGESGVGKEVIAQIIHKHSKRKSMNFVPVNMSAINHELFESQFFGHAKGSFTGAVRDHQGFFKRANFGTIFLDEIGDVPLLQQVKLLRTLQEGEIQPVGALKSEKVNVRVIAATHVDLEKAIESKQFRQDLFFRLNVFPIIVPPLRERPEDIRPLVRRFLRTFKATDRVISPEVLKRFERYSWPGNVRELENEVERLLVLSSDQKILPKDLHSKFFSKEAVSPPPDASFDFPDYEAFENFKKNMERKFLKAKIAKFRNIRDAATEGLCISPSTLFSKMKALNINRTEKGETDDTEHTDTSDRTEPALV